MGNGAFKLAILNAATAHLSQLFPNQRSPMKNGEHCKRQISSLKTVLRDINQWHSTLGVHWDNVNRAEVGMEEEKQVFKSWLQGHPTNSMCHFKNCGWPHLEGLEELYPNDQVHGSCAYHPASQAIAISDSAGYLCPSYPDTSSHILSDPIMMPSISFVPLQFVGPWVGTPSGTVMDGTCNDGFVEKPPNFINTQPLALSSPHSLMPPPASPAVFTSSAPPSTTGPMQLSGKCSLAGASANSSPPLRDPVSAQAVLQTISLEDDGE
ncbi:hypothetical protein EDC04DRAFT_2893480 [Pisolithus marmoratus]|nr:hypothetical protein EDC04DRAFT_2893480 [Pisolithus marmoratus]